MTPASDTCTLCGLPLRYGSRTADYGGIPLHFCCSGCRMVYGMLMEASESPDPSRFRESELYRRCVAAGVVPATEEDLTGSGESPGSRSLQVPYQGETLVTQFKVAGMWCPACAWVIADALNRRSGVSDADCDFATDRLRCRYDPTRADPDDIEAVVRSLGYTPISMEKSRKSWQRGEFIRLALCALLSINVMMLSWALYSGFFTSLSGADIRYLSWPILVMASFVMVYGGLPLYRKAWWGIRAGAPGMEALVCLGAGSAYLYSLYNFWAGSWHLYFDTATMLLTLVLLGKMLEARAKVRVRRDLEGFLELQPNKVRVCSPQFPKGRFADISLLTPGDNFRVLAGEIIPADGRVASGRGWVDESAVTGESRLKIKVSGDSIISGTNMVKGDLVAEAQKVGPDAILGQMITVVEAGLARRAPIESRTDRWLAIFVPLIVGLSVVTTAVTYGLGLNWEQAFVRGLTVLVIACPCALGIAVPLARIAGMSAAGRKGILVRDFEAFERAKNVDTVVFDKTGTLTRGRWSLERVETHGGMDKDAAVALAAGLEETVDHTIARAVAAYARDQGIQPVRVENVHAREDGVRGNFEGHDVRIGSWGFATHERRPIRALHTDGQIFSPVFLSLDLRICAVLWFGDKIRRSAASVVDAIRKSGCRVQLISGDSQDATAAVAAQLGIEAFRGSLLPVGKADLVADLQRAGRRVMMVGDGINDAPALAGADLSVAVHRDAALTQQAANVTLMRGDPEQLPEFLRLAERVNAKVLQNLVCAWVYNMVGLPIAMGGWLNPLVAVTAMLLSSLTVIGNTLLLTRHRKGGGFKVTRRTVSKPPPDPA